MSYSNPSWSLAQNNTETGAINNNSTYKQNWVVLQSGKKNQLTDSLDFVPDHEYIENHWADINSIPCDSGSQDSLKNLKSRLDVQDVISSDKFDFATKNILLDQELAKEDDLNDIINSSRQDLPQDLAVYIDDEMESWLQYPLDQPISDDEIADIIAPPIPTGQGSRAANAAAALALGAQRAAGLIPYSGADAFNRVRAMTLPTITTSSYKWGNLKKSETIVFPISTNKDQSAKCPDGQVSKQYMTSTVSGLASESQPGSLSQRHESNSLDSRPNIPNSGYLPGVDTNPTGCGVKNLSKEDSNSPHIVTRSNTLNFSQFSNPIAMYSRANIQSFESTLQNTGVNPRLKDDGSYENEFKGHVENFSSDSNSESTLIEPVPNFVEANQFATYPNDSILFNTSLDHNQHANDSKEKSSQIQQVVQDARVQDSVKPDMFLDQQNQNQSQFNPDLTSNQHNYQAEHKSLHNQYPQQAEKLNNLETVSLDQVHQTSIDDSYLRKIDQFRQDFLLKKLTLDQFQDYMVQQDTQTQDPPNPNTLDSQCTYSQKQFSHGYIIHKDVQPLRQHHSNSQPQDSNSTPQYSNSISQNTDFSDRSKSNPAANICDEQWYQYRQRQLMMQQKDFRQQNEEARNMTYNSYGNTNTNFGQKSSRSDNSQQQSSIPPNSNSSGNAFDRKRGPEFSSPLSNTDYLKPKKLDTTISPYSGDVNGKDKDLGAKKYEQKKKRGRDDETANENHENNEPSHDGSKSFPHLPNDAASKRSRAAVVHNLSERRRRDRINERMKALQELIPNSNKTDKASMLDEAIEYLKMLQQQLQVMAMRSETDAQKWQAFQAMYSGQLYAGVDPFAVPNSYYGPMGMPSPNGSGMPLMAGTFPSQINPHMWPMPPYGSGMPPSSVNRFLPGGATTPINPALMRNGPSSGNIPLTENGATGFNQGMGHRVYGSSGLSVPDERQVLNMNVLNPPKIENTEIGPSALENVIFNSGQNSTVQGGEPSRISSSILPNGIQPKFGPSQFTINNGKNLEMAKDVNPTLLDSRYGMASQRFDPASISQVPLGYSSEMFNQIKSSSQINKGSDFVIHQPNALKQFDKSLPERKSNSAEAASIVSSKLFQGGYDYSNVHGHPVYSPNSFIPNVNNPQPMSRAGQMPDYHGKILSRNF